MPAFVVLVSEVRLWQVAFDDYQLATSVFFIAFLPDCSNYEALLIDMIDDGVEGLIFQHMLFSSAW